ncbi:MULTISPECIES: hypothetical protein [Streptosporangium]|uniref:Uncharacterized protein n=1 Tax=Streptosporangium longisporum TaxID=46187 RepID=A0ABP6KAU7_9ACTN
MSRWITWAAKVTATAALLTLPMAASHAALGMASSVAYTAGDSTWT